MRLNIANDLYIREIEVKDVDITYQLISKNTDYLMTWFGWAKHTKSVQDREDYIKEVIEERKKNEGNDFVIVSNDDVKGVVGYIMKNERTAFIGYWLDENSQGNGLVTRSVKALIEYMFKEIGVHRIEINIAEENIKSRKIPERLNFRLEGILRDVDFRDGKCESEAVYSILKPEYNRVISNS